MLISIPTGTSTIFGVFQAILLVSFPFQTGLCATADSEANTDFRGGVIHFSEPPAQVCDRTPDSVRRTNFRSDPQDAG